MATKTGQTTLKQRLQELIDEAGGRAAFIRQVWGDKKVDDHKAKVSRWLKTSGMRRDQAELIAPKFNSRPAWLLYGEEPRRPDAARSLPSLADEVRNEVLTRAFAGWNVAPAVRAEIQSQISGEDMLNHLAELIRRDAAELSSWAHRSAVVDSVITRLQTLRQTDMIVNALGLLVELDAEMAEAARRSPWMAKHIALGVESEPSTRRSDV